MLVEATPGRSARILPSVSDSVVVIAEGFQSERGPHREADSALHERAYFAGGLPPWRRLEDNTDGVMSLSEWRCRPLLGRRP